MAREQDTVPNAKLDTVLFVDGTLTVDKSQFLIDLTGSTAGSAFEAPSLRTGLLGPRTVSCRWDSTGVEASKWFVSHANTAGTDFTYSIGTDGTGTIWLRQNAATLWVAAAVAAAKDYTISWSLRANPDSLVAADAMISEVLIYNHTDSVIEEIEQFTHVVPTTNAAWNFAVSGRYNGAGNQNRPVNTIVNARVSSSAHSHTEALEDWAVTRAVYAGTPDAVDEPVGPIPVASGLADVGSFAGRSPWGYTAAHANATRRRNWAPLVNEVYRSTPIVNDTYPANWLAGAPDAPQFQLMLGTLRWEAVPAGATHARVFVHLKADDLAGPPPPLVQVRVHAMNRLPQQGTINGQPAPALEHYYREVSITRDDTGVDGQWSDLGKVRLPVFAANASGWRGTTQLALSWAIDALVISDVELYVGAWHALPVTQSMLGVVDP